MPKSEGVTAAPCTNSLISGCCVVVVVSRIRSRYFQTVILKQGEVQVTSKVFSPNEAVSLYDLLNFSFFNLPYNI